MMPKGFTPLSEAAWLLATRGGDLLLMGNPNKQYKYHVASYNWIFGRAETPYYSFHKKEAEKVMREWNKITKPKRKDTDHTMKVHPVRAWFGFLEVNSTKENGKEKK